MANKTAEDWKNEGYSVYRKGEKDGIVVLLDNPPWGRCRAPFVYFLIVKEGQEYFESSYADMRARVRQLKTSKREKLVEKNPSVPCEAYDIEESEETAEAYSEMFGY